MATAAPSPDLGRRERRKLELRGRILQAAAALFEQQGFHATKVADICDVADIAQKTFFNHFPTKQDVLREIARAGLADTLEGLEAAAKLPGGPAARLAAFYDGLCDHADEKGPMHRELLTEILHVAHESSQPEDARRLQEAFAALLGEPGPETTALAELVLGSYYALMFNWAHLEGYPLRERAHAQLRLIAELLPT